MQDFPGFTRRRGNPAPRKPWRHLLAKFAF